MSNWMEFFFFFLTKLWGSHDWKCSDNRWILIWRNPAMGGGYTRWAVCKPFLMWRFHGSRNHMVRAFKIGLREKRGCWSPSVFPFSLYLLDPWKCSLSFTTEMLNLTDMPNLIYNLLPISQVCFCTMTDTF